MLNIIRIKLFALLLFSFAFSAYAQDKTDIDLVSNLFEVNSKKTDYKTLIKGNSNELQLITSGFFLFYKSFFSSQDGNHCVFHPSCSAYTIESIKKHGVFIGIIDGMDRLQRCNRLSPENYERYKNTNLLSDPVE
jgi:uncharacterized protein